MNNKEQWTEVITPYHSIFDLKLKEVWKYRDLLSLMIKRNFVAHYKQTILGPLWFFITPLLTAIMFAIIFSKVANIGTGGVPPILFYLSGLTLWNYFSETLTLTGNSFRENAPIFGKVYFPRLIMPLSIIIGSFIKTGIQFVLFLIVYFYYMLFDKNATISPNWTLVFLPLILLILGGISLGVGLIITSLTTKYRDAILLLSFAISLLMYATPVIYPTSRIANPTLKIILGLNPLSPLIENFRYAFLGIGNFDIPGLIYSFCFMIASVLIGIVVFNKVERSFIDTV